MFFYESWGVKNNGFCSKFDFLFCRCIELMDSFLHVFVQLKILLIVSVVFLLHWIYLYVNPAQEAFLQSQIPSLFIS